MQQETVRDRPSAGLRGGRVVWRTGQTPAAPSGREWQSSQSGEGATELVFPGPALGKMQSEAARRTGEPSSEGEEPPPQGLGGHQLLAQTDARCPACQVVVDHLDGQPGGVGGEAARGEMLERALERGYLQAGWVAGDDAFGMSPSFREGLAALGMRYVLDVPAGFAVWPEEPERTSPAYQGRGAPRKPRLVGGQRRTMAERSDELPENAWREITVAEGSQGPRSYRFSAQRVRPTSRRKPGEIHWAVYRRNLDGSEPRYYLSNAPEDTPLETLAYVGGSRWRIETEFEIEKSDVGLDEYETRTWAGWHHHVALCLLGGAFLLSLQQDWGENDAPDHPAAGLPGGA